jgi:iron(III) transport system ATP-binding protein
MIAIRSLVKRFGREGTRNAVNDITFTVPEGKLFTLLGQSGCGKSTTLRMIAGIEEPTSGEIYLGDQPVYSSRHSIHVPVNKRPIGMVFQSYAIWPHMTVYENVAFPLIVSKPRPSRRVIEERTTRILETVGLLEYAKRSATALSGGQQQRVALARALIREPRVLLLDEPLSNLDAKLREQMREEIRAIQQKIGITTVFVTHDQNEALAISDLILLMKEGEILEFGEPQHIYDCPRTSYGAEFIGTSNRFEARAINAHEIEFMQTRIPHQAEQPLTAGDRLAVYIRPESISLNRSPDQGHIWVGVIEQRTFQGDSWDYMVHVGTLDVRVRCYDKGERLQPGDTAYLRPTYDEMIVVPLQGKSGESTHAFRSSV